MRSLDCNSDCTSLLAKVIINNHISRVERKTGVSQMVVFPQT